MGVVFLATPFVSMLNREWHSESLLRLAGRGGPLLAGAAFAIAWTPCTSITLGAILTQAADLELGRARRAAARLLLRRPRDPVPGDRARVRAHDRRATVVKRHFPVVIGVGGVVMIMLGVLILTGEFTCSTPRRTN